MQREALGERRPSTLDSINNLGRLLKEKGDLAAAEPLAREALEGRRETLGARHPNTLSSVSNLGLLLMAKGDLAAAEPLLREALEGRREVLGARHPKTLAASKARLEGAGGLAGAPAAELDALSVLHKCPFFPFFFQLPSAVPSFLTPSL